MRMVRAQRPISRHVSAMLSSRSAQRAPDSVSLPKLIFCQITGDRSARSAALLVGATSWWHKNTHSDGSCRSRKAARRRGHGTLQPCPR